MPGPMSDSDGGFTIEPAVLVNGKAMVKTGLGILGALFLVIFGSVAHLVWANTQAVQDIDRDQAIMKAHYMEREKTDALREAHLRESLKRLELQILEVKMLMMSHQKEHRKR